MDAPYFDALLDVRPSENLRYMSYMGNYLVVYENVHAFLSFQTEKSFAYTYYTEKASLHYGLTDASSNSPTEKNVYHMSYRKTASLQSEHVDVLLKLNDC
jgi:hypothetical protein